VLDVPSEVSVQIAAVGASAGTKREREFLCWRE
jgi:hypothetical protein